MRPPRALAAMGCSALRACARTVFAALISSAAVNGTSAQPTFNSNIESCDEFLTCTNGIGALNADEMQTLMELVTIVRFGMSEADVTKTYRQKPNSKTQPTQVLGLPARNFAFRATWWVTQDSSQLAEEIDVHFLNGRAVVFEWRFHSLNRTVRITLSP